ncbi:MAG: FISUMP domain-containing protein [Candidatus Gracilibacteria bacterium]|nr:FISUMP domain-containing protein [Candidatus Gracilibacteria bacterium]
MVKYKSNLSPFRHFPGKGKNLKGFTLVELIVVITILAILGTIAFISLQGYSTSARDSTRVSDLGAMKTALELFQLDAGNYPKPTGLVSITYSGATVWNQGTFGETVFANLGKLDKIPKDPLTDKEYTYSVLVNGNQYQLGGIVEGSEISYNPHPNPLPKGEGIDQLTVATSLPLGETEGGQKFLVSQTNAGTIEAQAYITGNYNGQMTKVLSGTTCNVLAVPSIITNDTTVTDLQQIVTNKSFVYRGFKNLPASFKGSKFNEAAGFDFQPNTLLAYTDTSSCAPLTDNTSYTARVNLLKGLQDAYSGTLLQNEGEIKNILALTIDTNSPSQEVINYAGNYVNNVLKGKVSTGGGSQTITYSNCDFNGNEVTHNTSVTAYETTSVGFGNTCNSEQRMCNNGTLNGTYSFTGCTVIGATGTFNLSQTTVTQGTNVTISNNCSESPTSYTSSNTAVATVVGTTITTLSAGTTDITPVGGACGDNIAKTLTVNPGGWMALDTNCDIPDITIGLQVWAGCNSTLGTGFEWGKLDNGTNGTISSCYPNYNSTINTSTCGIGVTAMASTTNANTWFTGTNANGDQEYPAIWGKFYTWANAPTACPTGRHLPSDAEWETLETTLNGGTNCRNATNGLLCTGLGWMSHNTKTDTNNLANRLKIPLAGYRNTDGSYFHSRGGNASLWSSSVFDATSAYYRGVTFNNTTVHRNNYNKTYGFSVRCVKDL